MDCDETRGGRIHFRVDEGNVQARKAVRVPRLSLTSFKIGVSMCVCGNHGNQAPIQNKWLLERPNHDVATLLASQQIASRLTKIMSYTPRNVFPTLRGMF